MKLAVLLTLVCCLASLGQQLVQARRANSHEWTHYKRQHGKVYASAEEDAHRFARFLAAKEKIQQHNANPAASFKMGLSHLSDWTEEELAKMTNGYHHDVSKRQQLLEASRDHPLLKALLDDPEPVPDSIDWRNMANRISAVRDQGKCTAGWAFASTGVLEGQQVAMNFTSALVPLSAQQLVDCAVDHDGCAGGSLSKAMQDIAYMGGIDSEDVYPYTGKSRLCTFQLAMSVMTLMGPILLPPTEEDLLMAAVAKYGPIASAMHVNKDFLAYRSGVFSMPKCGNELNHAVLIVGYNHDADLGDYWIAKNSWGADWGESGYFRIRRNRGMCSIAQESVLAAF